MYVKIKVTPGMKKEIVTRKSKDHFDIWVREKAERNMANRRVLELVAREFGVLVGKVKLISGHRSPSKIVSVDIEKGV